MSPGSTISHYTIEEELGRGGMGVVFRAKDTKLNRTVALKLLPGHMLGSEEDRARFFREARSAAALHHPNIATVFEIDEHGDQPFIAMEYVAGGSLAERIAEGPLSLDEVIRVASQVATALKLAHDTNIVHRDIKSANVMLTADGTAKILDFGLAKTAASTKLTQLGSTLGTVAYMSPEQARGNEVDGRSDIWSLGVVLYEMISGKLPFAGDYEQAIIYGILNDDPPPLTAIRTGVPMELEWVVNKCLAKDANLRYQSAGEILSDLKAIQAGQSRIATPVSGVYQPVNTADPPPSSTSWPIMVAMLVGGLILGGFLVSKILPSSSDPTTEAKSTKRLTLRLPPDAPLATVGSAPLSLGLTALTISRDGRDLVYVGHSGATTALYHVSLETGDVREIEGTNGAFQPFLSPDGRWVAYFAGSNLFKVDLNGGSPLELAETADPLGGAWLSADKIVYAAEQGNTMVTVSSAGGELAPILVDGRTIPGELPFAIDEDQIIYSFALELGLINASQGTVVNFGIRGSSGKLLPTGHLVFARQGRLFATGYDLRTQTIAGSGLPVVEGIRTEALREASQHAISDDGTLVYVSGKPADLGRLLWVARDGTEEFLDFEPDYFGTFRLSPDGSKLLILTSGIERQLWLYDLERGTRTRIQKSSYGSGIWFPNGEAILYAEISEDQTTLKKRTLATNVDETVGTVNQFGTLSWMSPDGSTALINDGHEPHEVALLRLDEDELVPTKIAEHGSFTWGATVSPDGQFVAYTAGTSGRSEVWVAGMDDSGARWQISTNGGEEPIWSQSTNEIFFSQTPRWYSVDIELGQNPKFGQPNLIFEEDYQQIAGIGYAVAPDASRFLVVKPVEAAPKPTDLNVVVNWFDELERLVPTQ